MDDLNQANTPPSGQSKRAISPLLVIFLISGVLGTAAALVMVLNEEHSSSNSQDTAQVVNPSSGTRPIRDWQADDFTLTALDGEEVSLSDYDGKVIFLNFWRTDCAPCVRELPAFRDFMAQQGAEGAVVLAVNQGEDAAMIAEFLESIDIDAGNDFPVLLDEDMTVSVTYPSQFLPTTYVVNSEGMVQNFRIGEMTVDEMNGYLETDPNFRSDTSTSQG